MADLLQELEDLARNAGAITLKYFRKGVEVESKSDDSPVTIADKESEQYLRAEILKRFPGDSVIGEEFGVTEGTGRKWTLDPIDGTRSFVHGVPLYGVMIGVEADGENIAGAVYMPGLDELVVAERGKGAWLNGERTRVSDNKDFAQALLLTTDVFRNYKEGRGKAFETIRDRCKFLRTWGDCYGHVLVATGRADIILDPVMAPWDCSPLPVILAEAGGRFTDWDGKESIYSGCGISTNGHLHDEVLQIVRESGKSS